MEHKYEEYSEHQIALMREVKYHTVLQRQIVEAGGINDMEVALPEIAAYCGIIVDGYYIQEELEKLYSILTHKLRDMRMEIIQ
jgi:heptaprenylglyceryl phosphate synthase